jgi:hypothetical protein
LPFRSTWPPPTLLIVFVLLYLYNTTGDGGSLIRCWSSLPFAGACVHPRVIVGSVLFIVLVSCIVVFWFVAFVFCLVCPVLPVSLYCPFLIATSILSNVYLVFCAVHCGSLFVHFVLIHRELSLFIASSSLIVASTISPITTKTKNLTSY